MPGGGSPRRRRDESARSRGDAPGHSDERSLCEEARPLHRGAAMDQALGAFATDSGTMFRIWSSAHRDCAVRIHDAATGEPQRTEPLRPIGEGMFERHLVDVGHGARYRFVLDGVEVNDPYARCLPEGIAGPAMVYRSQHRWQHRHVVRPLREHVIYELHVGTFTDEGTYAAARERLRELVDLGVTALELLPVVTYGGQHGWGYDGVAHYAPHPAYGTPDQLRAFVDAAHGAGLAVFLDVVYNHFGPAGNVIAQYSPEYFTTEVENVWGQAPDFRQPWMRRYVLDNITSWIADYRFDGLRFDAVHTMVDPSDVHIVRAATDAARTALPGAIVMAEDDRNDPALVETYGFDAVWADDFHHAMHVTLTGESDGYYASYTPGAETLARTIERGWFYEGQTYPSSGNARGEPAPSLPAEAFIYCLQNHDQIGNRAFGDRLSALVPLEAYRASSMVLLFLPMTPLLYQGQEWAASTPFLYFTDHDRELGKLVSKGRREEFGKFEAFSDPAIRARIPDLQSETTFARSKLRWDERARRPHAEVLALYRELLRLRREDPVISRARRDALAATASGAVLSIERWHCDASRVLVANLGDAPATSPVTGRVVLASGPLDLPTLPAWSAAIVERAR
jgi:maltooligosyltrehalose trehalohydrolase